MCTYVYQIYQHKDLIPSRIHKDEMDTNTFIDPFRALPLVSISTGIEATKEVTQDLLNARELGKEAMHKFITDRLCKTHKLSLTQLRR